MASTSASPPSGPRKWAKLAFSGRIVTGTGVVHSSTGASLFIRTRVAHHGSAKHLTRELRHE
jgi:hypothetical protein